MRFKSLFEIKVWVKAKGLTVDVYKTFEKCRDYSYKDQIQRASVSIMNNIAEGSFRKSNDEFSRYLEIANSSNVEVKSMLYLALELGYVDQTDQSRLISQSEEIIKMIVSLQSTLS